MIDDQLDVAIETQKHSEATTLSFDVPASDQASLLLEAVSNSDEIDIDSLTERIKDLPLVRAMVTQAAKETNRRGELLREVRSLRHAVALIGVLRLKSILEQILGEDELLRKSA